MEAIKSGKAFIIAIGLLSTIILVLLIARYTVQNKDTSPKQTQTSSSPVDIISVPSQNRIVTPVPMPTMVFGKYNLKTTLPNLPVAARTFSVKTNYSLDEVEDIAVKFGLNTVEALSDSRYVTAYNFSSEGQKGYMVFDTVTGSFSFESYDVLKPVEPFDESTTLAYGDVLLKKIGMDDGTISCTSSYEVKGLPNRKYIECHRSAEKSGLAILGFPGVMNVPLDTALSSLLAGKSLNNAPEDKQIINTSDNTDGKSRPNDFNTITFSVSKLDGRIITIDSNIRTIQNARLLSGAELLTPREAFELFTRNKAETGFILPEGQGVIDFSKAYPNGTAKAEEATITDYILMYPEKPGTIAQESFVPYYLVRGTTRLTSGYETRFVQLVPALKQQLSFLPINKAEVAGAYIAQNIGFDKTQKQGGFKVESPTTPVSPLPTIIEPNPGEQTQCLLNSTGGFEFDVTLPGLGTIKVTTEGAGRLGVGNFRTLHVKSSPFPLPSINEVREKFFAADGPVVQQYVHNVAQAYQQNAGLVPQSVSVASVMESFDKINSSAAGNFYYCDSPSPANHIAPPLNCDPLGLESDREGNTLGLRVERNKIQGVAEIVAAQIATGIQSGTLQTFAQQGDIFPAETKKTLSWIFITNTDKAYANKCYLTGESPHIMLYPETEMNVDVSVGGKITYVNPPFSEETTWKARSYIPHLVSTVETDGKKYDSLYYEYIPQSIAQQTQGWIIEKNKVSEWLQLFSTQVGFNKKEQQLLLEDLNKTLLDINTQHISLSLIDTNQLNREVPLHFSVKPDHIYRFQLLVRPAPINNKSTPPLLQKMNRSGFTVVEVGARR